MNSRPDVPWHTTPALNAALADLWAATTEPFDQAAAARWHVHRRAAEAEGLCSLCGQDPARCPHSYVHQIPCPQGSIP